VPVLIVPFNDDEGPIITLLIGISSPRRDALVDAGEIPPAHRSARFLVDTGASGTCVDPWVLAALEIPPLGKTWMLSASTGARPELRNTYDVSLWLPLDGAELHSLANTMNIVECSLREYGFDGLLGRDVLSKCTLEYHGREKQIKLMM
jgi:hypothetical protein